MSVSDMELRYGRIVAALLTLAEAQERVLARVEPLPAEDVSLRDAAGRVTAEAAKATIDLPPFASSAMDGYAVRAADLPGSLAVVGHAAAGRPADQALGYGEAISISTGGVVPDGADSVVPIEYVVQHDNAIQVDTSLAAGTHVRPRGGDAAAGTTVVRAVRASSCSPPEPSSWLRVRRSGVVRSTSRTRSCSRPRSPPSAPTSKRC